MASQKVLCVGGLGYIGSIIANKFKIAGDRVDIIDCCLYDNEDIAKEISFDELIKDSTHLYREPESYDLIIWCSDIDVDSYYDTNYYDRDENFFGMCIEKAKKFYYMGNFLDDISTDRIVYQKFLQGRRKYVLDNGGIYFRLGILYGPSPRMRWDTLVNLIIFQALSQKQIILGDDWATRFPICNVADAADFVFNCDGGYNSVDICSKNSSLIEMAHVVARIVGNIEVITNGLDVTAEDFSMHKTVEENFKLHDTVAYMIKALEAGHLPDYGIDKYNNEMIIRSMIQGKEAYNRLIVEE